MSNEERSSLFRRCLNSLRKVSAPQVNALNIGESKPLSRAAPTSNSSPGPAKTQPSRDDGSGPTIDHRCVYFTEPHANRTFIGHRVTFMPNIRHASIEPGSRNPLGVPGAWVNDMKMVADKIEWFDDPQSGLFCRKIVQFKDVLGCKGMIEGVPYSFDDILQVGRNVVIYQLTNLNDCSYIVLGLGRDEFDPVYGLINHLQKVGEGHRQYLAPEVIALCDRVLGSFPEDETALFNKGVSLMVEKDFPKAHGCFEKLVQLKPGDQLAMLHNAATLALMGEDDQALEQFVGADTVSEEECGATLTSIPSVRDPLSELIVKVMQSAPTRTDAQDLWVKYFCPDIETRSL